QIFASLLSELKIDGVMTIATKGIPLAYAVATYLNVPVVIVRRDPKVNEVSSVSSHYSSASTHTAQPMMLTKQSSSEDANVGLIDDLMKAGGTISGMESLLKEFNANVKAIGVLAEADDEEDERVVKDYTSLIKITDFNMKDKKVEVKPGNFLCE